MRKPVVLITGASGEIGHGLVDRLAEEGRCSIVTVDLRPLAPEQGAKVERELVGSILDRHLLERIVAEYEVDAVFHLAALLSTRGEFTPVTAHQVNVEGTINLLHFAQSQAELRGRSTVFLYPSSIAVYGLPDLATKLAAGRVREGDWTNPITMYGCNKLYCEHLGRYFSRHYKQLAAETLSGRVDFRSIRFPGLISPATVPSGGTSDYAPEMIHAAAAGRTYACFVRPDTRIPFMTMSDAVDAMLLLARADGGSLSRSVYNIAAFSPSAEEIRQLVTAELAGASISYQPDLKRQAIVDSWPLDVDDSAARRDWGFAPAHGLEGAFHDHLLPAIRARHRT